MSQDNNQVSQEESKKAMQEAADYQRRVGNESAKKLIIVVVMIGVGLIVIALFTYFAFVRGDSRTVENMEQQLEQETSQPVEQEQ
jgi:cytoskeletal protein RodZ